METNTRQDIITIENRKGLRVTLSSFGARILSMQVPIKSELVEIHDYHSDHRDYEIDYPYVGATIGPFANRLRESSYEIEGKTTYFQPNEGKHVLHSGADGFHNRNWNIQEQTEDRVVFELRSESNKEIKYKIYTTFMVTEDNALMIQFEAKATRAIHINMTSHGYFNLSEQTDLSTHTFQIFADSITAIDEEQIPTGELVPVKDTIYDLREAHTVDSKLYDHNYVLNKIPGQMTLAAVAKAHDTGLEMHCYTTQPGLQFFTRRTDSFCFESQHFPDTPHHTHFPSTLLTPDIAYKEQCLYRIIHRDDVFSPFNDKK